MKVKFDCRQKPEGYLNQVQASFTRRNKVILNN
jgi:hypothetical protein